MKFKLLLIALVIISVNCWAIDDLRWQGKTITFFVTNNTGQTVKLGPTWFGDKIPQIAFPQGDTVAPHSTIYYTIRANPFIEQTIIGTLGTGIYINNANLLEVCDSNILITEHRNDILELTDHDKDGLYVATKSLDFSCRGIPVDLQTGSIHMVIEPKK